MCFFFLSSYQNVSGCRQVSGYRADCVPSLSPLLPEVFLFGLGFRFTNLCAVTNMCPVNEEIVSSLSPCCLSEVFMYGYQHVFGFRRLSGYRKDYVLPFSPSLCARTFVCASGRKCMQCSLIRLAHVLVAAALAPPHHQPWRQRQQLAPLLS